MGVTDPKVVCVAEATLHRIRLRRDLPQKGLVAGTQYIGSVSTTPDMCSGYLVLNNQGDYVFVPKRDTIWIDEGFFKTLNTAS